MRLLLDTHILLWLMSGDRRLTARARSQIVAASEVYASSASIWEIAIKWKLGKLPQHPGMVAAKLDVAGLHELPVTNAHVLATADLPLHHRDPFDRLLIAQAQSESMRLLTADARLAPYSDLVVRV